MHMINVRFSCIIQKILIKMIKIEFDSYLIQFNISYILDIRLNEYIVNTILSIK